MKSKLLAFLVVGLGAVAALGTLRLPLRGAGGASEPPAEEFKPVPVDTCPPVAWVTAATDAGRPVRLAVRVATPDELAHLASCEQWEIAVRGLADELSRLAPPDWSSNCHGWVFTGGRYWVAPEDVEHILQDNGYGLVSEPRTGDLVIYRDEEGVILHTGVVRDAGTAPVRVESKWGPGSDFLHPVEGHYNGGSPRYYRSEREGHLLRRLDGKGNRGGAPEGEGGNGGL
jgi:hypothetical protein